MPKRSKSYNELKTELDTLLDELARGDMDIEVAIDYFKRGKNLLAELEKRLKVAENTIKSLALPTRADDEPSEVKK